MTVAINFPTGQKTQPQAAYTKQQVLDRLMLWSENLKEHDAGTSNCVLTRTGIVNEIDRLLDRLSELRGR